MDLLHGLMDPTPGKDLGLVLPPLRARFIAPLTVLPLFRSPEGEGGLTTGGRGRHAGGPPHLHAREGGAPVVLLASTPERELLALSSEYGGRRAREGECEGERVERGR
jgi:hypothetical protein